MTNDIENRLHREFLYKIIFVLNMENQMMTINARNDVSNNFMRVKK